MRLRVVMTGAAMQAAAGFQWERRASRGPFRTSYLFMLPTARMSNS
jgi:hypothetical protein